jgi:UDP-glucose 4-epimerase
MAIVITGVAGFVGCNLTRELLARGETVFGFDNLSRGSFSNIAEFESDPRFAFEQLDLNDSDAFASSVRAKHLSTPVTEVWHLAANSDIPAGVADAEVDLRDTFMTTYNTLKVMKEVGIGRLAFASSSAIYGEIPGATLTEDIGPLLPISNYGAMKLASEGLITAAAESYLDRAYIFRFPNVIGAPATHGVVYDFVKKLHANSAKLEVLGNGTQQKAYLHVEELVEAMLYIRDHADDKVNYFNIGSDDDGVTVRFIAEETVSVVAPGAEISYGTGDRGWVGDVPKFQYSIAKLHSLGWRSKSNSQDAMRRAIRQIAAQEGL